MAAPFDHVVALGRRRRPLPTRHLFEDLRHSGTEASAREHGLPEATVRGVRSFYDELAAPLLERSCAGTACWYARGAHRWEEPGAHCFGRCYEAPYTRDSGSAAIPRMALVDEPVVLRHLLGDGRALDDYELPGANVILGRVDASGLRGRGGAAYPTGGKWRAARNTDAPDRVVVANGDEGDPGAYIDRLILEESPHALLAGMSACARAIGARTGIIFVRGEYERAPAILANAIEEARARGVLGDFDVRVVRGAGSYVAGEETALLRAIEGQRAEPRPKPPYPAERGLWGLPTVVQNVETLATIPWIVRTGRAGATKAFCLSGAVARPGVVEAALGITLAELLFRGGGGVAEGRPWRMALVGGPMGRVVPASRFDVALDYDRLPGMGHGGIVVLDDSVSVRALAEHLFSFAERESCGTCTPCRVGTAELASRRDRASLEKLLDTLEIGSLCGFGSGAPRPIRDLLEHYGDEVLA